MSSAQPPKPERSFDAVSVSRTNNPVAVAAEMAIVSVCELLEFHGHVAAAWLVATNAGAGQYIDSIITSARRWAARGGMGAYRAHRAAVAREMDQLAADDAAADALGPTVYPKEDES